MIWEDAWREGRTGWDAGAPAPALEQLIAEGRLPPGRALVTGVGRGYDAFALAAAGWQVTGLDIAPTAAEAFVLERARRGIAPERARIALGDFFTWRPAQPFDLIWDYTFLCALPPTERHRWGGRMRELLALEGVLATLVFPMIHPENGYTGPPWPLFVEDVAAALPGWTRLHEAVPKESHPGREGKERVALWRRPRPLASS